MESKNKILSSKNQLYKRLEVFDPHKIKLFRSTVKEMKVISILTGIFATVNCFNVPNTLSTYDFEVIKNLPFQQLDFAVIRNDFDKAHDCACSELLEWRNIAGCFRSSTILLTGKYSSLGNSCRNTKNKLIWKSEAVIY